MGGMGRGLAGWQRPKERRAREQQGPVGARLWPCRLPWVLAEAQPLPPVTPAARPGAPPTSISPPSSSELRTLQRTGVLRSPPSTLGSGFNQVSSAEAGAVSVRSCASQCLEAGLPRRRSCRCACRCVCSADGPLDG